eukprot:gene25230-biopygen10490
MNSCHEEGVRNRNRHVRKTNGHQGVEGWGAAVSDEMLSHGGNGCIRHLAGSRNVKWVTNPSDGDPV